MFLYNYDYNREILNGNKFIVYDLQQFVILSSITTTTQESENEYFMETYEI